MTYPSDDCRPEMEASLLVALTCPRASARDARSRCLGEPLKGETQFRHQSTKSGMGYLALHRKRKLLHFLQLFLHKLAKI